MLRQTFGSRSAGLSSCVPVVAPLSRCPPGDRGGHTLEVHRGRAPRASPRCQQIFILSEEGALDGEGAQLDHLSLGRGGEGRVDPMEHYWRQLERRTAAVLPRPYRRCRIMPITRRGGGGGGMRGPRGARRVTLLHQSCSVNRKWEQLQQPWSPRARECSFISLKGR